MPGHWQSKLRTIYLLGVSIIMVIATNRAEAEGEMIIGNARFQVITPECIRMEYAPDGEFIDAPSLFAIERDVNDQAAHVSFDGDVATLETKSLTLRYQDNGDGFTPENLQIEIRQEGCDPILWKPGMQNKHNLGGTIRTLDQVTGPVDLGEGLLARDGWYVIDESSGHLMTEDDWVQSRTQNPGATDWYFFGYGKDYRAALRSLTAAAGKIPMPRRYALGSWYSRYWAYTSDEFREIIGEYRTHDFPIDVIVLDMDWHREGWTGWSWNRELLPDAEELLKWFHEQNLHVTLNLHPADSVAPHEDAYKDFMKTLGQDPASGEIVPFDAADKEYMNALFEQVLRPLEREGVDFWWLDWQQTPNTRGIPDLDNIKWQNLLYYRNSLAGGGRGLQFSRWGGLGDHRYPIHFSGDASTDWPMLGFEVPFTSVAGNVGCFFWSHDIGGHMGARNEESYVRWMQFAATNATLRIHSSNNAVLDRRPWTWSKRAEDSMRKSQHLRSKLFPYIYTAVAQSCRDSVPLLRPMYIDYPEVEAAFDNPQEYMFGDNLLVAPIARPGVGPDHLAHQLVWFPEGDWYHFFTSEHMSGGRSAVVSADYDEFPMFVKAGMPIPLQPYTDHMGTHQVDTLIVRCYPGSGASEVGTSTLYEDDGVSLGYTEGAYAKTPLVYQRKGNQVTTRLEATVGEFEGQPLTREIVFELAATQKAESATCKGKALDIEYDAATGTNRVRITGQSIREGVEVEWVVAAQAPEVFAERALARRMQSLLGKNAKGLDLATAIAKYADHPEDRPVLYELLALAGFGMFENGTAYPAPGVLERLVIPAGGIIDDDACDVSYIDTYQPSMTRETVWQKTLTAQSYSIASPVLPEPMASLEKLEVAQRHRVLQLSVKGKSIELEQLQSDKGIVLHGWKLSEPYPFDPEIDITKQAAAPELAGKAGDVKWTPCETDADGVVNLHKACSPAAFNMVVYGTLDIEAPEARDVVFGVGSDDCVEVWLNGERIHSNNAYRELVFDEDRVKATLKKGSNRLMVKIGQAGGHWGYRVSIKEITRAE